MAAVTSAAIAGTSGLYSIYKGNKQIDSGKNELSNYKRQDLINPFKNTQISTTGSDLMREESGRNNANAIDASRNAGLRGIFGAIPTVVAETNNQNEKTRAYLDDQIIKRDYAIAEDETRLRGIKEDRDTANIAGISSQINAGEQNMREGLSDISKAGLSLAGAQPDEPVGKGAAYKNYFKGAKKTNFGGISVPKLKTSISTPKPKF